MATQFVGEIPPGRAPEHSHPYDEVVLILHGHGVAHIGGREHELHEDGRGSHAANGHEGGDDALGALAERREDRYARRERSISKHPTDAAMQAAEELRQAAAVNSSAATETAAEG